MLPEGLTIGIVLAAAVADSINPCVLGVLIFLVAFMLKLFKSPGRMLIGGLLYTTVVYATYLLLGFGILRLTLDVGIATGIYWLAALIAIVAGLLEIKDYFWYGQGFSLQALPGSSERIKYYTKQIEKVKDWHPFFLYLATSVLGVFVVLVELPCTGAPYLVILGLLSQGDFAAAVPLLLLYNLIFVLPLLVVVFISYLGVSSKTLEKWRKKNRKVMRLVIGLFLLALGLYMVYTIGPA